MTHPCPVEGCPKKGSISSLSQHFRSKHPQLSHLNRSDIEQLITSKRTIAMPVTFTKDTQSRWQLGTFLAGISLGIALAVVILAVLFHFEVLLPIQAMLAPS
jgi:hypothetical protein